MPGILPMKVIKVGTTAQARIAQACDRCRSKKIRCDGMRPSCTQCLNVGFECKTSDKLSRRAFPRGYTESLEERVRQLECEVRELKDLLDEKDEKIDMLSRIHSFSPHSSHHIHSPERKAASQSPVTEPATIEVPPPEPEDTFKVQQSSSLPDESNKDVSSVGTSSARFLIDSFKNKVQERGQSMVNVHADAILKATKYRFPNQQLTLNSNLFKAPPRLVSDQLVNIFFQEWAPLFPVLHRPGFLTLYDQYVTNPELSLDRKAMAQLNLVFGIAALSCETRNMEQISSFEAQWRAALQRFMLDDDIVTLQCLVLAQLYCLLKGDYRRLNKYKGIAVALSHQLSLNQSQKRFAFGTLTSETRKKVFWTLYTVDCFSAAQLGLPKLMKEDDIHCEYPTDADDEYLTEKGFLPTLPGESTKLSSALALFKASRILASVLTNNYSSASSHEISLRKLEGLSSELDAWSNELAPHLHLHFVQDKPSTNVISSRSPLLSLAFHYIRTLIWRPAVCANLGARGSSAVVATASSSKHIIQIMQLLEERSMSFTFGLNKNDLLISSAFGLLFQGVDAQKDGKLVKDLQKMLHGVADLLSKDSQTAAAEIRRYDSLLLAPPSQPMPTPTLSRHNSDSSMPSPHDAFKATQRHLKALASRFTSSPALKHSQSHAHFHDSIDSRRATLPNLPLGTVSQTSLSSTHSAPAQPRSEPTLSPLSMRSSVMPTPGPKPQQERVSAVPNLDYLPFDMYNANAAQHRPNQSLDKTPRKLTVSPTDWERLLSSLDNGQTNIYDNIYGGPAAEALLDVPPLSASSAHAASSDAGGIAWDPAMWGLASNGETHIPQSVLSFSEESLTSGSDELGLSDLGSGRSASLGDVSAEGYGGYFIPNDEREESGLTAALGMDGYGL